MRTFSYNLSVITLLALVVAVLLLASPSTLLAQPNPQMNYQGKLTNASGVAVPDGQYNMKFWLLASSTAATSTSLWAESRLTTNRVTVVNGLFSVMLGEVATLGSVDFNQPLYLGVEIGGISTSTPVWDGEMSPRKILGTVPAAFEAENAQTLGGIATSSFLRSDQADTMEATSTSALLSLIQNGAGKVLSLFRGVTEIFTVLNNGNVGIGTSTPTDKLQVAGNITPSITDSYSLGSSTLRFLNLFSQNIYASSSILTYATSTAFTTTNFFGTSATTTNLAVTGTATTTFGGGIQLLSGCFRDASATSTCIGKGQAATYVVAASNSKNKQYADYIADGTGDQVEINAAIQAAYTSSRGAGGKVYLLEGDYSVSGTTTMATSTMLVGSGAGTILKVANASNVSFPVIYFRGSASRLISGITLSDFVIDGNEANQSSGERYGVSGLYVASSTIKNLDIRNLSEAGITFDYVRSFLIANNNLSQVGLGIYSAAVQLYSDSSFASYDNTIHGNNISYGAYSGAGISLYGVSRTVVSGNTIIDDQVLMDTGIGIYQTSSNSPYGNSITGNTITNVKNNGIFLYDSSNGSNPILTTSITGNTITGSTGRGIHLSTAQQTTVTGNIIDDVGQEGILIVYSSNDNTITGNTILDANGGIVLQNTSHRNVISSNKITDTAGSSFAISISSGNSDNTLVGNYYSGTGSASISDAGTNTKYTQWDRLTLDTRPLGQVGYSLLSIYASSSVALASTTQLGTGKILSLNNSVGEMFTVSNGGNVGIGSSTPSAKLTVVGDTYIGGALQLTSAFKDSANATGTLGMILQTTGTSTRWVATSTLGIGGGASTFLALTDTPSSFTANRIMFTNSGATALTDSSSFVFDGTYLGIGNSSPSSRLDITNSATSAAAITLRDVIGNVSLEIRAGTSTLDNTFVGKNAGRYNSSSGNSFFGSGAGQSSTEGPNNSFFGANSGRDIVDGYNNAFFGNGAGYQTVSGGNNTFVGYGAGSGNDGLGNTFVGQGAGDGSSSGNYNSFFGQAAGDDTEGVGNLFLGHSVATSSTNGNYNIALGYAVQMSSTTGSNLLNIGNLLYGTGLGISTTAGTGNIGIGTSTPTEKLTVIGNMRVEQSGTPENFFYTSGGYADINSNSDAELRLNPFQSNNRWGFVAQAANYFSIEDIGNAVDYVRLYSGLTNGSIPPLTIRETGNIGIGTTTPTDKLQVAGNITPSLTDSYSLGSSTLRFLNLFSQNIYASSSILTYATSTAFTTTNFFGTSATTTNLAVTGTATTTFGGGIQLLSGCFRDASATSTCIGKGQAATYVVAASNSKNKQYADYIADGTGDQVEINAAIQAAYTTSRGAGGKVYLLEGDYSVSGTTTMATSTMLLGSGPGTILKVPNANNGNFSIIYFAGSASRLISGITVSDFAIDGNEDNQSSGDRHGVFGVYVASSTVKNLDVRNLSEGGIGFDFARNVLIANNNFNRVGLGIYSSAVQLYSDSSFASYDNIIEGNIITYGSYSGAAISLYGVSRTAVSHNTITGDGTTMDTGIGVYQTSSNSPYGNSIIGNVISNVQNNGIFLYDSGNGSNPIYTTSITGNTITNSTGRGIHLSTAQQTTVTGNIIDDAGQEGILVVYSSNNNTITGNTIWDANGGITVSNTSHRNVISSNKITDTAGSSYAIEISSGNSDNTIVGNYYSGTGAAAISDAGTNTKYTQWDRLTLDTRPLGQVGYSLLSIYASSSVALASTTQLGTGKILSLNNSVGEMFTVSNGGNVGIGSSTPSSKLTVVGGDTYIGGAIQLTSALKDSANATGTLGQILWSTGTSTRWVATSSLGITGGSGSGWALTGDSGTNPNTNFVGTTDAQSLSFRVNNSIWGSLQNTSKSVFFGENSGRSNASTTSNLYNVGIGYQTFGTTTGSNSASGLVAIGTSALFNNTTGVENVAIGYNALTANVTGGYSTAVGYGALSSNDANYNSAFGSAALLSNTTGSSNSAFGTNAMRQNVDGYENAAFGDSSLRSNTSGVRNAAFGHSALYNSTDSNYNVAGGYRALYSNTTGDGNIAFGVNAFGTTTVNNTGNYNIALGSNALFDNTTGDYNVVLGDTAMRRNTTGYNNVALGQNALLSNTTGNRNIAVGLDALNANTTGYSNIAIGQDALGDNTNAYGNLAIGAGALSVNTIGTANVALGQSALTSNISGGGLTAAGFTALYRNTADSNSAFGFQAGYSITSGTYNTAIGRNTFGSTTAFSTGNYNIAIGESALFDNTTGADNIGIGVNALDSNATGQSNIAIGREALTRNFSDYNTAVGDRAGYSITSGTYNTALGRNTFGSTTALMTGTRNVAIGEAALYDNTTGAYNVGIGAYALSSNTTGEYNIGLGYNTFGTSTASNTGDDNIGIGRNALFDNTTGYYNVAIGSNVLQKNVSGIGNTGVGTFALSNNVDGSANSAFGDSSLGNNVGGYSNSAFGSVSMENNTDGYQNSAFGTNALRSNTTGDNNIAFGFNTFGTTTVNNTGNNNVAIGSFSLFDNTTGASNVGIGALALNKNTEGYNNVGIGANALAANTTGQNYTAVGYNALANVNSGSGFGSDAFGSGALQNTTSGNFNSAFGAFSLQANTTGAGNAAFGSGALYSNINGMRNSAFGLDVLNENTSGTENVAFGWNTLDHNTTGYGNTAFGTESLKSNATGDYNVGIGYTTFGTTTATSSGSENIGIGRNALFDNLTGQYNIAIGSDSLNSNTSGSNNVAIGRTALRDNVTGDEMVAIGYLALRGNTTGYWNTAVGANSLQENTTGILNTAFGRSALQANISGGTNTAVGSGALYGNIDGSANSAFGYDALISNISGEGNVAMGASALRSNATGDNNIGIGASSFGTTTATSSGSDNIGIGTQSLFNNITGIENIALGGGALYGNVSGMQNTAVGYLALNANRTGSTNSAFGEQALTANTNGSGNSAFGRRSLNSNLTGDDNVAFGYHSMLDNTSGSSNSAFGNNSLENNTDGTFNTAIGQSALYGNISGDYNVALGNGAGTTQTGGNNNLFFGYNTSVASTTGSNQLSIGNLIYGTGLGTSDGFVGIGTSTPSTVLHVVGSRTYENVIMLQNTSANGASGIGLFDNNGAYKGGIGYGNYGYAYSDQLAFVANDEDISFVVGDTGYIAGTAAMTISNPSGNVGIGTTTPEGRLSIANTSFSTAGGVAGIDQYFSLTNSTNAAVQYGNRSYIYATNTATTTIVGSMYRLADSTTFGNTVRGLEVQVDKGNNTRGENTALSGFARTFGVRGTTIGDAGGTYEPAGVYGETQGSSQGNAIRGYSSTITSAALLKLFQDTSAFTGTGLLMNFGNSGGSYSSTTASKFIDLQNAGTSMFTVGAYGKLTIGDGTTSNNAGIQVGYGGLCVDNDGSCNASTTGRISAVSYHTGNSDLAEVYFSDENLKSGEVVYLKGGLSVGRASEDNKEKVIGVVTTKPGLLLGFDDTSLEAGEEGYGVALAGRVPVRLSNENGEIKTGDELMLSSIAGVVMKASSTGKVVGVALEDFEENRAYSDTYINQFGDDLVDPIVTPISASNDPRMNDGCYYGAGNASGEAPCVPLVATTTDAQVAEAQALAEAEAQAEALAALANVSSKRVTLDNGEQVKVGQIVMFVDLKERYLDEAGKDMVAALLSSPESSAVIDGVSETVWTRLVTLANNFVDGVLSVFTLKADRVEVKDELCVDGVCLNAEDIRQLLENSGGSVEEEPAPEEPPIEEEEGDEEPPSEVTEEGSEGEEMVEEEGGGEEIGGEQTGNEEEGSGEEETAPSEGGEEEPPVEENPTPEEPAPEPEPTPEPAL